MAQGYPSAPRSGMPGWAWALIGCGCLGVLVFVLVIPAMLLPVFMQAREKARSTSCLMNLKQLGLASAMYTQDFDERLPYADGWCEKLMPYAKNERILHCPTVSMRQPDVYGYAFDDRVSGKVLRKVPSPATASLLYDSTNLARNAVSRFDDLPVPGRHRGANAVAYVDGHAQWVGGGLAGRQ